MFNQQQFREMGIALLKQYGLSEEVAIQRVDQFLAKQQREQLLKDIEQLQAAAILSRIKDNRDNNL